jgi:dynein heavy chain
MAEENVQVEPGEGKDAAEEQPSYAPIADDDEFQEQHSKIIREVLVEPSSDSLPNPVSPMPDLREFMVPAANSSPCTHFNLIVLQMSAIRTRINLPQPIDDLWRTDLHFPAIEAFLTQRKAPLLVAFIQNGELCISHSLPTELVGKLCYFLRIKDAYVYPGTKFSDVVQTGVLHGDYLASLVRIMNNVFAPLLTANESWPESVRNEFAAGLNRFMSTLTDASHRSAGKTVLYVPSEDLSAPVPTLIKDRELVQRLDSTVIHWTRLIRDVLSSTGVEFGSAGLELPLDEIEFWRQRVTDMSGISTQLDRDEVLRILAVARAGNSSYISQFDSWATRIKDGMAVVRRWLIFKPILSHLVDRLNQTSSFCRFSASPAPS